MDLFITDFKSTGFNRLYKNNGDLTFSSQFSAMADESGKCIGASWADFDNDGDLDVFIPKGDNADNALFRNDGANGFVQITDGPVVEDGGNSVGSCWGDIDNDRDLDLFVSNASDQENFLYRNNGDGTFTRVRDGSVATDKGHSHGCSFVDVDNDGDLDLFVANDQNQGKFLYMNDGLGNFSSNMLELITAARGNTYGCAWSDFDRDGDMDVSWPHIRMNLIFCIPITLRQTEITGLIFV